MKPRISLLWDCLRQFILSCTTPLLIPTVFLKLNHYNYYDFCFKYLISIVFHLAWFWANQFFTEWGAGGRSTHTHGVLSERNQYCVTVSVYEQASALFYLSPQYLMNSYPPQKIMCTAKITAHLGNMPQPSHEMRACQKHYRCCLSFLPSSWLPSFL